MYFVAGELELESFGGSKVHLKQVLFKVLLLYTFYKFAKVCKSTVN